MRRYQKGNQKRRKSKRDRSYYSS